MLQVGGAGQHVGDSRACTRHRYADRVITPDSAVQWFSSVLLLGCHASQLHTREREQRQLHSCEGTSGLLYSVVGPLHDEETLLALHAPQITRPDCAAF